MSVQEWLQPALSMLALLSSLSSFLRMSKIMGVYLVQLLRQSILLTGQWCLNGLFRFFYFPYYVIQSCMYTQKSSITLTVWTLFKSAEHLVNVMQIYFLAKSRSFCSDLVITPQAPPKNQKIHSMRIGMNCESQPSFNIQQNL